MLIDTTARAAMRQQIETRIEGHHAKTVQKAHDMLIQHARQLKENYSYYEENIAALKIRVLWDAIYIFVTSTYICDVLYKIRGCDDTHIGSAAKKIFKEMGLLDLDELDKL